MMSYICPICGNSHNTTGCPTPRVIGRTDGNCIQFLPEQYNRAIAAAEQRGYERALDVAMLTIGHNRDPQETITIYEVVMKLGKLKSDDLKQEGKNDRQNR